MVVIVIKINSAKATVTIRKAFTFLSLSKPFLCVQRYLKIMKSRSIHF
jgi:hypothetical protein